MEFFAGWHYDGSDRYGVPANPDQRGWWWSSATPTGDLNVDEMHRVIRGHYRGDGCLSGDPQCEIHGPYKTREQADASWRRWNQE